MKEIHIFLIIADCLRYDMIEKVRKNELIMPNTFEFANKSAFFANAFANAPSTHFAVPSIMTGMLPYTLSDSQGIARNTLYLPALLKNMGFFNIGITTNVVTSRAYGYMKGFDYFEDFIKVSSRTENINARRRRYLLEKMPRGIRKILKFSLYPLYLLYRKKVNNLKLDKANYIIDQAMDGKIIIKNLMSLFPKLDFKNKNHFFFLHFVDIHAPYVPPLEFLKKYIPEKYLSKKYLEELFKKSYRYPDQVLSSDDEIDLLWNLYLASANYFDHIFNQLLSLLKDKKIIDNSLVILMVDHGEAFGEHSYLQHPMNRHNGEQIRIPLIIHGPGIAAKKIL